MTAVSVRAARDDLWQRWREDGSRAARDELIARHMPLARSLARRYERSPEQLEDLVQVANLALVKAVEGFDPARGYAFTSYAVPTILGELKRHLRDTRWALHVTRSAQELSLRVESARGQLTGRLGRTPTVAEFAHHLGVDEEAVLDAFEVRHALSTVSLDAPSRTGDEEAGSLGELLGGEDERFDWVEQQIALRRAIELLPAREQHVLTLRFMEDLTQTEIANHIGVSQMHVSRLLRRSLARLRLLVGEEASPLLVSA